MKQFQPSEIHEFLEVTDSYLKVPVDLIVIGGAAAALAYKASKTTTEYDQINLSFLRLYVPEQHDLALMKIVRGYENDIQTICEIHENMPFCFETLMERFLTEMTHVIGNSNLIRLSFLLTISKLSGDELADQAEELTKNWQN